MNHELLLPGHLIGMYLKEKLSELLLGVRAELLKMSRTDLAKACLAVSDPKCVACEQSSTVL
jgi:hypothetical protein